MRCDMGRPMASPKHERNDIAIAQKAIGLARGLSGADKAVAAAIIDHFNQKTGQCDPSNERLAALLDIDQKTVRRATAALSAEHAMFIKKSHGGKSCRASYTPVWATFRAIVDDWSRRMKSGEDDEGSDENRAEMSGSERVRTGQNCPANRAKMPYKPILRTYLMNLYPPKPPQSVRLKTFLRSKLGIVRKGA